MDLADLEVNCLDGYMGLHHNEDYFPGANNLILSMVVIEEAG